MSGSEHRSMIQIYLIAFSLPLNGHNFPCGTSASCSWPVDVVFVSETFFGLLSAIGEPADVGLRSGFTDKRAGDKSSECCACALIRHRCCEPISMGNVRSTIQRIAIYCNSRRQTRYSSPREGVPTGTRHLFLNGKPCARPLEFRCRFMVCATGL